MSGALIGWASRGIMSMGRLADTTGCQPMSDTVNGYQAPCLRLEFLKLERTEIFEAHATCGRDCYWRLDPAIPT